MGKSMAVKSHEKINLKHYDAGDVDGCPEREEAEEATSRYAARIGELQDRLYANGRRSLLAILQGMDASGKDGTVRRVFDNVNPTGVTVTSFKEPTWLERKHDFLWRCHEAVPPRGVIGVFNRSYYEEVLIVRVHADKLLPPELKDTKELWETRYELIKGFEKLLELNGTKVLKFFLHISKEEQKERFIARQKDPAKHWKLAAGDFAEREYWGDYQKAYEEMMPATSTKDAQWHIVPGDRKWVRNYHVAKVVKEALEEMDLKPPKVADEKLLKMKFR